MGGKDDPASPQQFAEAKYKIQTPIKELNPPTACAVWRQRLRGRALSCLVRQAEGVHARAGVLQHPTIADGWGRSGLCSFYGNPSPPQPVSHHTEHCFPTDPIKERSALI